MKYYLIVGEASGDLHASPLIHQKGMQAYENDRLEGSANSIPAVAPRVWRRRQETVPKF